MNELVDHALKRAQAWDASADDIRTMWSAVADQANDARTTAILTPHASHAIGSQVRQARRYHDAMEKINSVLQDRERSDT